MKEKEMNPIVQSQDPTMSNTVFFWPLMNKGCLRDLRHQLVFFSRCYWEPGKRINYVMQVFRKKKREGAILPSSKADEELLMYHVNCVIKKTNKKKKQFQRRKTRLLCFYINYFFEKTNISCWLLKTSEQRRECFPACAQSGDVSCTNAD